MLDEAIGDGLRLFQFLNLLPCEITDTNTAHLSRLEKIFHGSPCVGKGYIRDPDLLSIRVYGKGLGEMFKRNGEVYLISQSVTRVELP